MTPQTKTRRRFATAAVVGVALYVLVDVVLQFLPPHYSVLRDAESNLAVGPFGWIMNLNFLGRTLTVLCALAAIHLTGPVSGLRQVGVGFLAAGGLSSAVLAFFPTDVDSGSGLSVTTVGTVHLYVAGLGFVVALSGIVILTRWVRSRQELAKAYPAALSCAVIAAAGLAALLVTTTVGPDLVGLAERICLAGLLGWVLVVGLAIRRLPSEPQQPLLSQQPQLAETTKPLHHRNAHR